MIFHSPATARVPGAARTKIRFDRAIDMPWTRPYRIVKMPLYPRIPADPAVAMSTTLRNHLYIAERRALDAACVPGSR